MFGGKNIANARFNDLWKFNPTTEQWTWVAGSNTANQAGIYGTKGVAAADNVPGARENASAWIDSANVLWLFGGNNVSSKMGEGTLNDLWKFDPNASHWTWVSGTDQAGQPGVYGTKGVGDVNNGPGARAVANSWVDSTHTLWLFGGLGSDSAGAIGELNDLWRFNSTLAQWTWVSGSNTVQQPGVYNTKGAANASNHPGARYAAASWIDNGNTVWLLGGAGQDSTGAGTRGLNDLWRFAP